ncbi:MAG: endolytic transglycosylase MltG [Saprospiraceae bacterium]|nr:endolytic transglycosylase MltG [Saprospiraceae bacterium]
MRRRIILILLLAVVLAGAALAWHFYTWIYHPNTASDADRQVVLVYPHTTFDALTSSLLEQGILLNEASFRWVAKRMQFDDEAIKDGRYRIAGGLSNYDLIHQLRLGQQEPMDLVMNSAWSTEDLCGKIGQQLAIDSVALCTYLYNVYLPQSDYSRETLLSLFIPNTYEVYWNTSEEALIKRLEQEHATFWSERRRLADSLGLTPEEVYTLASIVERETRADEEKPTIAGVYLNRINRGMLLQADPTVLYALGDFSIRRVLNKHLTVDSPYNTYKYPGLPPGPITMPSIASIDAVLRPERHNYLFFCAKPGQVGYHVFASTLAGHMRNARAYQSWLNAEGIR